MRTPWSAVMYTSALPLILLALAAAQTPTSDPQTAPVAEKARPLPGKYMAAEPTIAAGAEGRVVVSAIEGAHAIVGDDARPDSAVVSPRRLVIWRSEDGGGTWAAPFDLHKSPTLGTLQADPWLQRARPGEFAIAYLAGKTLDKMAVVFQRSEDGGKTWAEPHVFHHQADKTVLGISPSGNEMVVAFSAFDNDTGWGVEAERSRDRGKTWERLPTSFGGRRNLWSAQGIVVTDQGALALGWRAEAGGALNSRVRHVLTATTDGGKTWKETEVTVVRRAGALLGTGPALALDGAGAAHALWVRPADANGPPGVFWASCSDFHAWSEPVVLAGGREADWRGFPAIAASGPRVHAAWIERKGERYHVWYRGSADGGKHWSERLVLSQPERPSDMLTADGFREPVGDYMSLVEDGAGTAHAVWETTGAGKRPGEIWHTTVRWKPNGNEPGRADHRPPPPK